VLLTKSVVHVSFTLVKFNVTSKIVNSKELQSKKTTLWGGFFIASFQYCAVYTFGMTLASKIKQ
jgi:hypothetical protein